MKITKYNIVKIETTTLDCTILGTFDKHENAIEFMCKCIDLEYLDEAYIRLYHENKDCVAVYNSGYVYGKTLICKYRILTYEEDKVIEYYPYTSHKYDATSHNTFVDDEVSTPININLAE